MRNTIKYWVAALFLIVQTVNAQVQKGELTAKRSPYTAELTTNEKHVYTLNLQKDKFVVVQLIQKGVDVKINTYDPSGKKLQEFDSPNGKNGPEMIIFNTNTAGYYMLEVEPFDAKDINGAYEIAVLNIKPKATTVEGKVDQLFTAMDLPTTPGASLAVVRDGAIIYKKGYGMANLEYDIPISPSTVFHVASVSKQFTAFSVLLLESRGELSIDDDIRKYIPEVPDFGTTITLRHLLTHTSGMRDQWNLLAMAGWRLDDVITKEQILKLISKQKELNFQPGEEYLYCNTGFTLLAEVVARVSEKSFAEFTHENIFQPLGMKNTLFYDDHEKIVKNRAYSYRPDGSGFKKSVLNYANVGATSLFTTAEDMALWAINFATPKVGNSEIIKKMSTPELLNNGKAFGGAMGQFVGEYKGVKEIQHGGADAGYRSYFTRYPDQDFAVVVLGNFGSFNSGAIAHEVVDIYLKDVLQQPEAEASNEPELTEEATNEEVSVDMATLRSYEGEYEIQPGFILNIFLENDALKGQATGQGKVNLIPASHTEFDIDVVDARISFVVSPDGSIPMLKLHQGGQTIEALRLEAFDKDSIDLTEFAGTYYSEELSTSYKLVVKDGTLIATHSRHSDNGLLPMKEDVFASTAWYLGQLEFLRDENKKIKGCNVSNGRVRALYFEKVE